MFSSLQLLCCRFFFSQADKAVAEEKLEAARPALEEAEAALQVDKKLTLHSLTGEGGWIYRGGQGVAQLCVKQIMVLI